MDTANVEQITALRTAKAAAGLQVAEALAAAEHDSETCFELGVAYSTGTSGADCDPIAAHMWFNLAAVWGHEEAADCRAELAGDMNAREIAEAQRRARRWLAASTRRAA